MLYSVRLAYQWCLGLATYCLLALRLEDESVHHSQIGVHQVALHLLALLLLAACFAFQQYALVLFSYY